MREMGSVRIFCLRIKICAAAESMFSLWNMSQKVIPHDWHVLLALYIHTLILHLCLLSLIDEEINLMPNPHPTPNTQICHDLHVCLYMQVYSIKKKLRNGNCSKDKAQQFLLKRPFV